MDAKDVRQMLDGMREQLAADEAAGKLEGMGVEALAAAVSHPKAPEVIGRLMELETGSVQEGDPAPDFTLPWLHRVPDGAAPTLTLSERLRSRPVALIFGSYT